MTIFNWHESCRRPDVKFNEGLGVPACSSCGCIAALEGIVEAQHHDAPLVPSPRTRFELTWPLSLPFVDDPSVSDLPGKMTAEPNISSSKDVRGNVTLHIGKPTTSSQEPATDSSMRVAAPYEPLFARKIRLLKLLKGNYNDPIRVELQVADLTIKPEYEALSYTWADEKKDSSRCEKIYIGERWDILLVTKNCFNALRRLRFSYRSRRLWVDAICINQNDAGERSHQVGMMQSIYATATRVLIYLGENSKDEDTTSSSPWNFDIWNERSLPRDRDLTQEPYFKRVWVIQEIAAAQNPWVLFGTKGDRWLDFLHQVEETKARNCSSSGNSGDRSNRLHQLQNWFHVLPQGKLMDLQELPRLLQATALCKATDPRDRVYALLGLFQGAKQAQLIADYSLSVDQVFSGLTACMLCQSPAFMLPIFAALQPSTSSLPTSWAIDWSSASILNNMGPYLPEANSKTYLISEPRDTPRFYHNGTMVLRGRLVSQLSSYLFDSESRKGPPGVVKGHLYRISDTRFAEVVPDWAELTDEVLEIRGLKDHALVLRPVMKAPKAYHFVAVAKQPQIARITELINHLDRKVILLFSAWQYVLRGMSNGALWFQTATWDAIKAICWELKHARNMEGEDKGSSGFDFGTRLRDQIKSYGQNRNWSAIRWKTNSEIQREANKNFLHRGIEQRLQEESTILLIFGWELGAFPNKDESGRYQRKLPWNPAYFEEGHVRDFLHRFSKVYGYAYRGPGLQQPSPARFVRVLLSQGLDQQIITFEGMLRTAGEVLLRWDTLQEKYVPWSHDSLNLKVGKSPGFELYHENIWHYGPSKDSPFKTWAADFIDSWTLLVNKRPRSPDTSSTTIAEQAIPEEVVPEELIPEERNGDKRGFWTTAKLIWTKLAGRFETPEVKPAEVKPAPPDVVSEVNWEPLLDLVRETEARLLPLEEAFTRTDDTYDEDMKDVPWEDIRII
ncbi:hypothetical protein CABS03_02277 [Colletotrichum abscissum]|uniref:Heterokaryon incompatibility domain-containing protein n=2 Tax=Colletotrichum abscissum TaxID=1671311 RepID=A0A9Q0B0F3_9PEZI|nr:hypothetical protein CABS02_10929 [Colletotrichum abscissum]